MPHRQNVERDNIQKGLVLTALDSVQSIDIQVWSLISGTSASLSRSGPLSLDVPSTKRPLSLGWYR